MKILLAHNNYQQFGGEDAVAKSEYEMFRRKGEDVHLYLRDNLEINQFSLWKKGKTVWNMHYSKDSFWEIRRLIQKIRPDVVHVINTFFLISPSIYYACRHERVPVVQSLYNYRLMCANALFQRNGEHCTDCLTKSRWRSVLYPCYRNSRILTALVVKMINHHWKRGTWNKVNAFLVATEFAKQKFVQAGIDEKKIYIKPQFIFPDPPMRNQVSDYALYAGRLSHEKGIQVLLKAWRKIKDIPLKIMGDGPMRDWVRKQVQEFGMHNVQLLGHIPSDHADHSQYMNGAKFIIVPSVSHENFPRIMVEAYSYGIPVLASSLAGVKDFVEEKKSGILFKWNDPEDLRKKARWLISNDDQLKIMNQGARDEYEQKYTSDANYRFLMSVYNKTIDAHTGGHLYALT